MSAGSDATAACYIELDVAGNAVWGVGLDPSSTSAALTPDEPLEVRAWVAAAASAYRAGGLRFRTGRAMACRGR